jgi:hypothetical protein
MREVLYLLAERIEDMPGAVFLRFLILCREIWRRWIDTNQEPVVEVEKNIEILDVVSVSGNKADLPTHLHSHRS